MGGLYPGGGYFGEYSPIGAAPSGPTIAVEAPLVFFVVGAQDRFFEVEAADRSFVVPAAGRLVDVEIP